MLAGIGKRDAEERVGKRTRTGGPSRRSPISYPRQLSGGHEDAGVDLPARLVTRAEDPADGRAVRQHSTKLPASSSSTTTCSNCSPRQGLTVIFVTP